MRSDATIDGLPGRGRGEGGRKAPSATGDPLARCELYRLLSDPVRPRLLALASLEELAVGELAELVRGGQPAVSRHAAALREAGLLSARRQGTWTLLRLAPGAADDPVVADAVRAGMRACKADGTLERVNDVLSARDKHTREFFARGGGTARAGAAAELPAYLAALAPLVPSRRLAIDAGTGDGALLDVLAPVFDRVLALDRSAVQLELAAERVRRRGYDNVTLVRGEIDGPEVAEAVARAAPRKAPSGGPAPRGADALFAVRVLHHAPAPLRAMRALVSLARPATPDEPGGAVVVLDYEAHGDEALREQQADLWLGFDPAELRAMAEAAGLERIAQRALPKPWQGDGPDRHLAWQLLVGFRAAGEPAGPHRERVTRKKSP